MSMPEQATKLELVETYIKRNDEVQFSHAHHNRVTFTTGQRLGIPPELLTKFGDIGARVCSADGTCKYEVRTPDR